MSWNIDSDIFKSLPLVQKNTPTKHIYKISFSNKTIEKD